MRQSRLFSKPLREAPADAPSLNAKLLERAGFVHKNSAGIYSYLPLGWRVIQKISAIVREEMDALGAQELLMPALLDRKYLDATGRFDVPIGYEAYGKGDDNPSYVLGWTHEEVLTDIARHFVHSYKDLPFSAYQIQTKFRNEPRAKSGVLRGREFIMKDLYSFHASDSDFEAFYAQAAEAYRKVFTRCGLTALYTIAGGGAFTASVTHEFQVISPIGEDTVFSCSKCAYAENSEVATHQEGDACPKCGGAVEKHTAVEVGNIFPLGTKYSEAMGLTFLDEKGASHPVVMGSYGIGISRLMGVIAETHGSETGLSWPSSVAPFSAHLLDFTRDNAGSAAYDALTNLGVETLYDDRNASPGEKFAVADLVGIPFRAVVSDKTAGKIEVMARGGGEARLMDAAEFANLIKNGI